MKELGEKGTGKENSQGKGGREGSCGGREWYAGQRIGSIKMLGPFVRISQRDVRRIEKQPG